MKTIYWILIIAVALIVIYYFYNKSQKKSLGLSKVNPNSAQLLFVGDSLTEYTNSFVDQLKRQYPDIGVTKIASSGKQTSWMVPSLSKQLSSGNRYNIVTIWGGVNDIYATGSIEGAKKNLQEMYDLAKQSGAKVVALTVIPTATYNISTAKTTQLTNELNKWIRSNKSVDSVVDVNYLVNNGADGTKAQYLQPDTLHLTAEAHALIEKVFSKETIKKPLFS